MPGSADGGAMPSAEQCDMSRPEQVPGVAVDRIRETRKRWGDLLRGVGVLFEWLDILLGRGTDGGH